MKNTFHADCRKVLSILKTRPLNTAQALKMGIHRLKANVTFIQEAGIKIKATRVTHEGKRVSEYSLA